MKQATFLWKNNRGIYFFRARIPKQFSEYFKSSEIKKSLKTDSYRLAVKLARAYRVELDKEMEKLEKGTYYASSVTLEGKVVAKLPDGSERLVEGKIERNLAEGEDATPHKEYLLKQLREEADQIEKRARDQALFEKQLSAIQSVTPPNESLEENDPPLLFSDVMKPYLDEGEVTRWKTKTKDCVKNALNLFLRFAGDLPIKSIDKSITRDFKNIYMRIPHRRAINANPDYQNKTIAELAAMVIPEADLIDVSTVGNNMGHISTFFKWAIANGYVNENPFEGLRPRVKKKASKQRDVFEKSDLKMLFESEEYINGFLRGSKISAWKYWIPIIALYSGMRLEEISRLRVENFAEHDGINTIEITPDGEWVGKTDAALRVIPIHPTLINLGLLKFVEHRHKAGFAMLFDLTRQGDGYGDTPGAWFTQYRRKCGIDSPKKVFHSFRHTFANEMKQRRVSSLIIGAIVGHEDRSITTGRYGKDYNIPVLFEELSKVDFGIDHPPFRFDL